MWKDKYSGMPNDVDEAPDKEDMRQMLADSPRGRLKLTCAEELLLAVNELPNNKSSGLDKIPSELYKYAPACIHVWLADFFNMMLVHAFL